MSTDLPTETSTPSPTDGEPTTQCETTLPADREPSAGDGYDAHEAAATFDTGDTRRLPNTVDRENQRVG